MRGPGERGSIAVVTVGVVAIGMVALLALARLGSAAVLQARADTAADAAALAAADQLALGRGSAAAQRAAQETAVANGGVLVSCLCGGSAAEVMVEVAPPRAVGAVTRPAHGRARAEVDLTRRWAGS